MSFLEKTASLGVTDTEIYVCPVTQAGAVHGLVFSNITGSSANFSLKLFSQLTGLTTTVAAAREVPANSEFAWPKPINITAGDKLIASSSIDSALTVVASIYIAGNTPAASGFRARGNWSSVATYEVNDIAHFEGSLYVAVYQNVNSQPPSANWMVASSRGEVGIVFKGEYNPITLYAAKDVVISPVNHWLYIAVAGSADKEPSANGVEWDLFLQNDTVSASAASATAAASSASAAAASATAAGTSATNSAGSATSAATQVGLASVQASDSASSAAASATSATNSSNSATASATSATNSANSATASANSATSAATQAGLSQGYATNAATSDTSATTAATKAGQWADANQNVQVETGKYSAKHWAMQAQASVAGTLIYRGSWNASGGTYPTSPAAGDYYKITVGGTISAIPFGVNDSIIYNGVDWDKIDSTDSVASVAGKTGTVTLVKSDVGLGNVDNTTDASKPVSTAQAAADTAIGTAAATDATNKANAAQTAAILASAPAAHVGTGGTSHANVVAAGAAGFMTGADKTKLDGIATSANNYSLPMAAAGTLGGVKIGSGLSIDAGGVLSAAGATNIAQGVKTGTTVPVTSSTGTGATLTAASATEAGVMTAADKVKLDGIAAGATVSTVTSVATKTGAVTLVKADVGLGNVDNTTDAGKPVSTAQAAADTAIGSAAATDATTKANAAQAAAIAASAPVAHVGAGGAAHANVVAAGAAGFMTGADKAKLDGIATGGSDAIRTPVNATPSASATGVMNTATLTGSAFLSLYGLTMAAAQFQVSTVSNFASTVISTGDVAGTSTSYTMASGALSVGTVYYWRCRYKDSEGVYSTWSTGTSFTTASSFNSYIATPTATPAAFGDSFEGGFYTGQIWNELVQSASSYAIGTGSKAFTVADMTATPLVYAGQTLEVRSRANPANKMIGVVTGASGTALTINVTSVGGAGTFTDWSIMAQYCVIVAPKATGENSAIAYKNANDAAPAACGTLSEGRKATLAMVAAGTSTVYPAAHWCNNLSIAGKTDWYLPARDELELCWRNLKPTADNNYTTANRDTGATPNYMNLGSYGDTANTHGLDNNSSPVGAAHISGTPAQVAAGKNFRTSESEAFAYGSFYYWSASEYSATSAWLQYWLSSVPGYQLSNNKTDAYYVRAVRRSII